MSDKRIGSSRFTSSFCDSASVRELYLRWSNCDCENKNLKNILWILESTEVERTFSKVLTINRLTPSLFECDHWRPDMFVFVKSRQTKCSTLKFFQFSEIILSESFSQWENFNHPQLISYNEISNPLWEFKLYNELMINKNRNTYNLCFYLFD